MYTLSIIHPSILFKCSHSTHGWILFHFTHSLSVAFSPFPLLFLLLSPLIYLNHPPGENRSLSQSGTNCFVRFTNPEPNPDKRFLVRAVSLFVFARVKRLCYYQSIYCATVLYLWMQSGPEASQHIKAVTNMEQGPNGIKCCRHKWDKHTLLLIRSHF